MPATISLMALCAVSSAWTMSSSDTSFAPASTMTMPSLVPATVRSSVLLRRSSNVGLTMKRPSTRPIRTPASVRVNGMPESASAVEAPVIASTSESFCVSADMTSAMICVSCRHP